MGETVYTIGFIVFALLTLGSGLMVVLSRNLFHSSLFLLSSLFGVAGLFVLLVAPFLAVIQVLVYMGAIGILIVFAIMLTRGMMHLQEPFNAQSSAAIIVAAVLFVIIAVTLTPVLDELGMDDDGEIHAGFVDQEATQEVDYETVNAIGMVIADRGIDTPNAPDPSGFVLPFELASLVLTAAMIGAIVVAREDEA